MLYRRQCPVEIINIKPTDNEHVRTNSVVVAYGNGKKKILSKPLPVFGRIDLWSDLTSAHYKTVHTIPTIY